MDSVSPNDKTVEVYNLRAEEYIAKTPQKYQSNHTPMLRWLNFSLAQIPKEGEILEIGSGNGREAIYMQSKGYRVYATDVVKGFVDYLQRIGLADASFLNILKDELPERKYDLILANAVFPHFTPEDVDLVMLKVHEALKPHGLFAFSLKQGKGDSWVNEKFHEKRYIHFWQPEKIRKLAKQTGYKIIFFEHDIPGDIPAHTWINATLQKID